MPQVPRYRLRCHVLVINDLSSSWQNKTRLLYIVLFQSVAINKAEPVETARRLHLKIAGVRLSAFITYIRLNKMKCFLLLASALDCISVIRKST